MMSRTRIPPARGTALALALMLAAVLPAGASTENTPTPYTKCAGWLDNDDAHQFRQCYYREMSGLMDAAARSHNAVMSQEQRIAALPRSAEHPVAFEVESCDRTRQILAAIDQTVGAVGESWRYLDAVGGNLRAMKGQIAQHASFQMRNRAMMRGEIERTADANLQRIHGGMAQLGAAAARLKAMRVIDRCRERRPDPPNVGDYRQSVVFRGVELRPAFGAESVNACHWFCSNNKDCRAFTFTLRTAGQAMGACQLFSVKQSEFRDPCCWSKIVRP